eukprot:6190014-Pleurochrysis_carterae.AAC.3
MARQRDTVDWGDGLLVSVLQVTIRHSYRPPDRLKGRVSRLPCGVGGDKMALYQQSDTRWLRIPTAQTRREGSR